MLKILSFYLFVSVCVLIINLCRYIRCCMLLKKFRKNVTSSMMLENMKIKFSSIRLFRKSRSMHYIIGYKEPFADTWCIRNIERAFENSKCYFLSNACRCLFWFYDMVETASMYAVARKIKNKIFSFIFALLQTVAVYLIGLYLDTTGIGNSILKALLSLLKR